MAMRRAGRTRPSTPHAAHRLLLYQRPPSRLTTALRPIRFVLPELLDKPRHAASLRDTPHASVSMIA